MERQREFNFQRRPPTDGLAAWRKERDDTMHDLAIKLGLPVGHLVEVRLKDGVVLRGKLRVGDVVSSLPTFSRAKLALEVDGLVFTCSEIESCVRVD